MEYILTMLLLFYGQRNSTYFNVFQRNSTYFTLDFLGVIIVYVTYL